MEQYEYSAEQKDNVILNTYLILVSTETNSRGIYEHSGIRNYFTFGGLKG